MPVQNAESHQVCVRIKHSKREWFEKRAKLNPKNKYGQLAAEINDVTDAAFEADPNLEQFKKSLKKPA